MPSIFRFVLISALLASLVYGAIYALANLLEPAPRDVTVTVPPSRYAK
jgi:xanthosine utilization system XapX-like protein